MDQRLASSGRNKSAINNCASATEKKSSLASDKEKVLREKCTGLCLVNYGEITFYHANKTIIEWDGLVKNTDVLVLNEAKASPKRYREGAF